MRFLLSLLAVVSCAGLSTVAVAQETGTYDPQGSSVGNGQGGPPAVDAAVRTAATRGGCRVRAFRSEGILHGTTGFSFPQTPPVSGTHAGRWADWGVYVKKVPHQYQVHNLEHGGVVVHIGSGLRDSAAKSIGDFVSEEPGYLVITPRASRKLVPAEPKLRLRAFPGRGFVVTSWQRRMVCKGSGAKAVAALRTYTQTYRGTGPEQVPSFNSSSPRPDDLPAPEVPTGANPS